ncbi:methyltransferase domain-containing protein [candidate division KSB1 bacterium]|nr:methyltransferase domain-containing protein [candidate division KSB1 bacterium]RQW03752.1 MAG: methyltransferase domain-containing protein [candidate division KSB1 bacterium]
MLFGRLYDALLEPLLHGWKSRVAEWIATDSPGLTLDICCGTGKQCRLLAKDNPVVGLDLNYALLRYAKRVAPEISFVCADAKHLPFKTNSFQNANISLALHDKPENIRTLMVDQVMRVLQKNGFLYIVDFEKAKSIKAKIGYSLIYIIELMAGYEHFSNGRDFVTSGGLSGFIERNKLFCMKNYTSGWGSSSITMNKTGGNNAGE